MITDGNILKPSEVNPPGTGGGGTPLPVFLDLSTTPLTAPIIRVVNFTGATNGQTVYITDDGLVSGNALFSNIYLVQISVIGVMGGIITACSATINSNTSLTLTIQNMISGATSANISLFIIGN